MASQDELVKEIAAAVRAELSSDVPQSAISRAVGEVVASRSASPPPRPSKGTSAPPRAGQPRRAVLTASGVNRPGILAKMCEVLARRGADIHDVSQSLAGEYFHMIILFDLDSIAARGHSFLSVKQELEVAAKALGGMNIVVMREDVLRSMHRI